MAQKKSYLNDVKRTLSKGYERNIADATTHFHSELQRKLTGNRSGETGTVPGTNTPYTMSAPGEPPALATGNLLRSFKLILEPLRGIVGSRLDKARYLEEGTRHIAKRPYFQQTMTEQARTIEQKLRRPIK